MVDFVRIVGEEGVDPTSNNGVDPTPGARARALSRLLPTAGRSLSGIVFHQGKPALDAEMHLLQALLQDQLAQLVHQLTLAGWPQPGAVSFPQAQQIQVAESWAVALGHVLHVADPDAMGAATVVALGPPPASGTRTDLVFLEFWFQEIAPAGAQYSVGVAPTTLLKEGGVANQAWPNDLVDPAMGAETTRRVQLRWRWRVVAGAAALTDPTVYGQGGASATQQSADYRFTALVGPTTQPRVYRAGPVGADGRGTVAGAAALATVDGFTYALPAFLVSRYAGQTLLQSSDVQDVRQRALMVIPDHSLVRTMLARRQDVGGPAVQGSQGTDGSHIAAGTIGADDLGTGVINRTHLVPGTLTDAEVAAANKDGLPTVPSLRTLGAGAQQACAGNDPRLSDARAPTGPAGGALSGSYPNPGLAAGAVQGAHIAPGAVTDSHVARGTLTGGPAGALQASTVTGWNLQAATITGDKVAPHTLQGGPSGHLVAGTITDAEIAPESLQGGVGHALAAGTITDYNIAAANKDGLPTVPSLRTLGAGAQQAAPGNHTHVFPAAGVQTLRNNSATRTAAAGDVVVVDPADPAGFRFPGEAGFTLGAFPRFAVGVVGGAAAPGASAPVSTLGVVSAKVQGPVTAGDPLAVHPDGYLVPSAAHAVALAYATLTTSTVAAIPVYLHDTRLAPSGVTNALLATGAVDNRVLTTGAVDGRVLALGSVQTGHLTPDLVTARHLGLGYHLRVWWDPSGGPILYPKVYDAPNPPNVALGEGEIRAVFSHLTSTGASFGYAPEATAESGLGPLPNLSTVNYTNYLNGVTGQVAVRRAGRYLAQFELRATWPNTLAPGGVRIGFYTGGNRTVPVWTGQTSHLQGLPLFRLSVSAPLTLAPDEVVEVGIAYTPYYASYATLQIEQYQLLLWYLGRAS